MKERRALTTEAVGELKMAKAGVALQSTFRESIQKKPVTQVTEVTSLLKHLATKIARLLQLPARHEKSTNRLNCFKIQIATENPMSDDLGLAAEAR